MPAGSRGRAVVVGGGLAGLSAAWRLGRLGWEATVLEAAPRAGGRCTSSQRDGFIFDHGAQYIRDSYESTIRTLIGLGLGDRLRIPGLKQGVWIEGDVLPFTPRSMRPDRLFPLRALPRGELIRLPARAARFARHYRDYNIRFPWLWKAGDDESASAYLGPGLQGGGLSSAVCSYALGASPGELSAAALMAACRLTFFDRTGAFSEGAGRLAEALARELAVIQGMTAEEVSIEGGSAVGVTARPTSGGRRCHFEADAVICAVPAGSVIDMTGALGVAASEMIEQTRYAPAVVVNLAFSGDIPFAGGPVLVGQSRELRCSWLCSGASKAWEYAGEGTLVTLVYDGDGARALLPEEDPAVVTRALGDAAAVRGREMPEPAALTVDRYEAARPIVSCGHARRSGALTSEGSGVEGLFLAGDWTSTPTIEGAVSSGLAAAESAASRAR